MTSKEVRESYLIEGLFAAGEVRLIYSYVDRVIVGSAVPLGEPLALEASKELASEYFTERREIGVMNIGESGSVSVDGEIHNLCRMDVLYIGRGSKDIRFESEDADSPARFYLVSYPAHADYPTKQAKMSDAEPIQLGSQEASNRRTIYKCIHPDGIRSCQLVMGFTVLEDGNVWNTMPPHSHARRMEVYMYCGLAAEDRVFHLMGEPGETRHIVMKDGQAVISPSWSIHAGVGTKAYTFVWCMGGENQAFDDMDAVSIEELG
jgi:4-deoxy-L-threo-5-hexosulose-uronate ketol-isomerase